MIIQFIALFFAAFSVTFGKEIEEYTQEYLGAVASIRSSISYPSDNLNDRPASLKPHERRDPKKWVSENIQFGLKHNVVTKNDSRRANECSKVELMIDWDLLTKGLEDMYIESLPYIHKGYMEQNLDHFNASEPRTWMQYFVYNKQYSTNDSINFLHLGGEGRGMDDKIVSNACATGAWAKQFGANLYGLEHRFYGKSQPFGNVSESDLRYLSSEQALADAAVFIKTINEKLNITNPKWIVFGGSYSGNLAAWMRLKYPDLVLGAVASSAPVQATLDFKGYYPVVADAIRAYGPENCTSDIRRYFSEVQTLLLTEEGRKRLGVENENATFEFLYNLMPTSQHDNFQHEEIKGTCDSFRNLPGNNSSSDGPLDQYSKCKEKKYSSRNDWFSYWSWQKCTEFGYFKTTPIDGGIFDDATLMLRGYIKYFCADKFPEANFNQSTIQAAVDKTNSFYGGNKNFNATNVVFVNGSEDPWHVLSVYDTPNDSVKTILVQGTSHCRDYGAEMENDPRALKNARQRVVHEIDHWLELKEFR